MAVTVEILRDLQQQAAGSCTACLRDNITANTSVLGDLIDVADNMAAVRRECFENEELYQQAFCEVISAVLIIAVFTAELDKRPRVLVALSAN
jgi:hypothetical protein